MDKLNLIKKDLLSTWMLIGDTEWFCYSITNNIKNDYVKFWLLTEEELTDQKFACNYFLISNYHDEIHFEILSCVHNYDDCVYLGTLYNEISNSFSLARRASNFVEETRV